MDSLTHTVLGACLGETIAGKQLGKKAMVIGALANNFPDIDVFAHFFTTPAGNLLAHRGITHSIFACLFFSLVFSLALPKIFKKTTVTFKRSLVLIGSGLFLHILMDACTSYGTGWFEPFSHYRVSFNTLFIIDPFFLLPLLIATVTLLILKKTSVKRLAVANTSLTLSAIYLLITVMIKIYVNEIVKNDLQTNQIPNKDYMVTPTPLNNLLWNVVTQNEDNCYIAFYSIFDKEKKLQYEIFPKQDSLLGPYKNSEEVSLLKRFSKNYYCFSNGDSSLIFSDLRFGRIGGWYDPKAEFVFNFDIIRKNDATHIQQARIKALGKKPVEALLERIRGK